jgi:hypothetical protein
MAASRRLIGQDMLVAVNDLVLELNGTPEENTKKFWDALAAFGPEYLVGQFHMDTQFDNYIEIGFNLNQ